MAPARARPASPAQAGSERRRAVQLGLALTARRRRTERELHEALHRAVGPEPAQLAIERLRELRYLDDAEWAREYVARSRSLDRGASLLRRELRARGIGTEDAQAAIAEHDEAAAALRCARRRLPALARLDPERRAHRLRDHLLRRGFSHATIESTLARLATAEPSPDAGG